MKTVFTCFCLIGLTWPVSGMAMGDEHDMHHMTNTQTSEQAIRTSGTIKSIADDHKSVRIFHDPIPELKWPAMNMKFDLQDHEIIHPFAAGDKVHFEFIRQGSSNVVTKIEK